MPTLRNLELTAPYFHNGGQATIRQVVEFYNRGGDFREHNSRNIDFEIGKLNLTNAQIDDLVAFPYRRVDGRTSEAAEGAIRSPSDCSFPTAIALFLASRFRTLDGAKDDFLEVPEVGPQRRTAAEGFPAIDFRFP